jgi:hypothetical protein
MLKNRNKQYIYTNYLIVILAVLAVSPFFNTIRNHYLFYYLVFVFIVSLDRGIRLFDFNIFVVMLMLYVLILFQGIKYEGFSFAALYTPLILFYLPYLIFHLLRLSFFIYFIRILYVIAIYTFFIWLVQSFFPPFDLFLQNACKLILPYSWGSSPRSLLFYTSPWGVEVFNEAFGVYRNSGIFHEPGAYAIYLCLGIIMNYLIIGRLIDKRNIVFFVCLLTTLSTTGYVVIFIVISVLLWRQKLNIVFKFLIVGAFVIISIKTYKNEEFLQQKVEYQFEDQIDAYEKGLGKVRGQSGRFFSFITSYNFFLENPIFGRGILYVTSKKASGEMHEDASYGYGFIGMFSTFGIIFGLYYLFYFYRSFRHLCIIYKHPKYLGLTMFIAINLALLTQILFLTTIFVLFFQMGLYSKNLVLKKINYSIT